MKRGTVERAIRAISHCFTELGHRPVDASAVVPHGESTSPIEAIRAVYASKAITLFITVEWTTRDIT